MRREYRAIVDAGFVLQLDCPDLAMSRALYPNIGIDDYRKIIAVNVEALNHAVRDLPPDRMRMHVCWGSTLGPHHNDVPLKDIVDIILKARPQAVSFPGANPRHGHEWKVWQDVKLPDGKIIIPGVIDSTSNFVEHPELVADRIVQYARHRRPRATSSPASTAASAPSPAACRSTRKIVWMKLAALAEGARLASQAIVVTNLLPVAEAERLGHDAEHLGVVDLAAHALAAGAGRGQDHVLAGMHAGVQIFRQIAEPKHGAGLVAVALVRPR